MTHRMLGLLLALLLSVSVTAQTPWQPSRTSDGQPDMQGYWLASARLADLSLERDYSLFQADFKVQRMTRPATPFIVDPPDEKIPYQPWALEKRRESIANMLRPTVLEHIDSHTRGWDGVPRINHAPPWTVHIVQVPGTVVMLYESNHAFRVIPLDGRPHVSQRIELFLGDSRGRWEGNTLVVNVTNQNGRSWLDWQSFHGKGLHVTERWTQVNQDRLDYRATLTDETMFTQPWTIAYYFTRITTAGFQILEDASREGERDVESLLRWGLGR